MRLTYAGNPLRGLSEWQAFPSCIICRLGQKIGDVFLATGAVGRPNIPLCEHATVFFWLLGLLGNQHVEEVLDLLSQRVRLVLMHGWMEIVLLTFFSMAPNFFFIDSLSGNIPLSCSKRS